MQLKRVLGARDAAWLVAGNMIGAGIFYTPGLVAGRLPGLAAPLFAWGVGGLLALCGAAVYGELGARFPRAGGDYQYLTHAFGPMWGFLTGWAAFLLTFAAATAAMILVVLDYLGRAIPWLAESGWTHPWLAGPLLALLLTVANVAGARVAGKTTALMTGVPLLGILLLFGGGLLFGEGRIVWPEIDSGPHPNWSVALGAAMIPIFFSYTGWNVAAYVAGEVREPARNLARGLIGGTLAVTLVYLLINLTFLLTVPQSELAGSTTAGADAVRRLLGPEAERLLSIIVALAVLGTANVTMMAGSRIYFAMAVDGLAPRSMGRVNRAGVPAGALWISGIWTGFLTVIGGVESLVNWATLAILLLSSLTVGALFVFRRRDASRPAYACPLYPLTPLIYLATCLAVALASMVDGPRQALIGVAIVAAGIPVYFVVRHLGTARSAG